MEGKRMGRQDYFHPSFNPGDCSEGGLKDVLREESVGDRNEKGVMHREAYHLVLLQPQKSTHHNLTLQVLELQCDALPEQRDEPRVMP